MSEDKEKNSCPCENGKLHKKCCGENNLDNNKPQNVISLTQARWRHVGQQMRERLSKFADSPSLVSYAIQAQNLYLGILEQSLIDPYDDFILERCFEWFIFDYPLPNGNSVIETFQKTVKLNEMEKNILDEWLAACISFYEVTDVFPKKGITVKDIITKNEFYVRNRNLNPVIEVKKDNILLIRILKVGKEYEFSTSGLILPTFFKGTILHFLKKEVSDFCRLRKLNGFKGLSTYLKERAHYLNAWVLEFGLSSLSNMNTPDMYLIKKLEEKNSKQKPQNKTGQLHKQGIKNQSSAKIFLLSKEIARDEKKNHSLPSQEQFKASNLEKFNWPKQSYAEVASQVLTELKGRGYNQNQQDKALKLWYDFCCKKYPNLRKVSVWVAVIIYTMARLEFDSSINQQSLAIDYGVAASTISIHFRSICQVLSLVNFDKRYSTQYPSLAALEEKDPILAEVLKNLKL